MTSTSALAIQACAFALGAVIIHALRDRAAAVTAWLVAVAVGIAVLALLAFTGLYAEHNPSPVDDPVALSGE